MPSTHTNVRRYDARSPRGLTCWCPKLCRAGGEGEGLRVTLREHTDNHLVVNAWGTYLHDPTSFGNRREMSFTLLSMRHVGDTYHRHEHHP